VSETDHDFDALGKRVSRLASSREALIDPLGVAHATRLYQRAKALPEDVRSPLVGRLVASLDALASRVARAHTRATGRIDELARDGADVTDLRTELGAGRTDTVEYRYRRRIRLGREVRRVDSITEAKLASLARSMGIDVDPTQPMKVFELASQLYDRSASDATAALLLHRLPSSTGEDEGRYHTASVVASVLRAFHDASPTYMSAMLSRLEVASEITRFLKAFEPIAEPVAPKSERPRKSRSKKSA